MIIGLNALGKDIFAAQRRADRKVWTEKCRKPDVWVRIPQRESTIKRCLNNAT